VTFTGRLCLLVRGSREGWKVRFVVWLSAPGGPLRRRPPPGVAASLKGHAGFSSGSDLNGGYRA
jgi:hypothetical protein